MADEKQKRTILVLEDERQLAKAVRESLSSNGFNVIVVDSVEDGLFQLEHAEKIDAIWLDHYLLGSADGLDFVVQIKNNEKWKTIPIFVVSNTASEANVRSYIQLGIENYYTKADYDVGQIVNDITYAIEHSLKKDVK